MTHVSRAQAEASLRRFRKRYPLMQYQMEPCKLKELFMPNLADSLQNTNFVSMLTKAESADMALTEWESGFVSDMRAKFDAREDQADMGMTPWSPTVNQWNTLKLIAEKV